MTEHLTTHKLSRAVDNVVAHTRDLVQDNLIEQGSKGVYGSPGHVYWVECRECGAQATDMYDLDHPKCPVAILWATLDRIEYGE